MSKRVTVSNVISDTLYLLEKRKKLYSITIMLMLISSLSALFLSGNPEAIFTPVYGLFWVVIMLVAKATYVVLFNASITTMRGSYSLFPQCFWKRYFRTIGKMLALSVMVLVPGVLLMVPVVFVGGLLGIALEGTMLHIPTAILVGALSMMALLYFGYRWGLAIPAIAVGETSSFKLSWRMTKGHSFRMVVFAIPFGVVQAMMQLFLVPDPQTGVINFLAPASLIISLLNLVVFWLTFVSFVAWYVRLKERYDILCATDADYGQCQD